MLKTILLILLAMVAGCPVAAQTERRAEVYLSTGAAFPTRDFNLKYNYGFNGSAGVGFRMVPGVRLLAKAEVQTFSLDQNYSEDTVSGGNCTVLMTGLDLRLYKDIPRWRVDPVLLVGGGIAYASVAALTVGGESFDARSETKFYINVGAGLDVQLTPALHGFLTGRYVRISTGGTLTEFFPISVGVRF
jgi:hypothetical protein